MNEEGPLQRHSPEDKRGRMVLKCASDGIPVNGCTFWVIFFPQLGEKWYLAAALRFPTLRVIPFAVVS